MSEELHGKLRQAIVDGDADTSTVLGNEVVADPSMAPGAVNVAIDTIRSVGDRFGEGEVFLPEMILAAEAMQAFMDLVKPHLAEAVGSAMVSGKAVVGTVKGDIHTIGKDIVATMLSASGFDVIDMGVDVAPMDMIETAEKSGTQLIGLSSLMTTSMPYQKEVIDLLTELKIRDDYWVIVGGGPVTPEYAESIGADGWALSAAGAVELCTRLLSSEGKPSTTEFIGEAK